MTLRALLLALFLGGFALADPPGMVVAQEGRAAAVGARVMQEGGNAVDAAVATAFALAVTHPIAGNLGGGGFLLLRRQDGKAELIDFRETAPTGSHPTMFLVQGRYDAEMHHFSHRSVGVPGTVRGLHLAWQRHGKLPWKRLVEPARRLAADGFPVTATLAASLKQFLPSFNAAGRAQFSRRGEPLAPGDLLRQPELARSLARIAKQGPDGFYRGETAALIVREMQAHGGLITARDLEGYRAVVRQPLRGSYRGVEVLCPPPPSGGGIALLEMLNQLEGYDLPKLGEDAIQHLKAEAMRRAFADRARWIGDPAFNPSIPLDRLNSKEYAAELRRGIDLERASVSSPERFTWGRESEETTHLSVVDGQRNAVSLTYTLEDNYGSRILVPGAGFLLNNEMGDFNGEPGRTDAQGMIGTAPNLAAPGKRMLSSMCPTLLVKEGRLLMVTGSPGGRTIPNTVLHTILNVVDFGMGAQAAVDAPRLHHQWLPDEVALERDRFPAAQRAALEARGHKVVERSRIGVAQVIRVTPEGTLEGGADRSRWDESAVAQ